VFEIEVDVKVLQGRLAGLLVEGLHPLSGGASSLSYAATATIEGAARPVVVKVAPAGLAPVRNRDVLRQARLLRALAATAVPVPEVLWEDPGAPPEIPPLFVMSYVEGTSLEPLFDIDGDDPSDVVAVRMHDAARVLATLHGSDPDGIGLGGEQRTTTSDEIDRWTRALETVDSALAPDWQEVAATLRATQPAPLPPAVLHGDFRLGNMLADGDAIAAVIDWEIWSLGDPRVDLGWFLVNADPDTYRRKTPYAGLLPTPAELVRTYEQHAGYQVPDLHWFEALACFKSTATWSLIVKHARRRPVPDPLAEEVAGSLPGLLERARHLLG